MNTVSPRLARALVALLGLALAAPAVAASLHEGRACLEANDVVCADAVVQALDAGSSRDADTVAFAAQTAFYAGRFEEAHDLLQRAVSLGWVDRWDDLGLFERTREATQDWTEARRGRFRLRYLPGIDAVLVDDGHRTLELSERHLTPVLGSPPPGTLSLELYPDGRSFIAASSLTRQDVLTTGVVALSKWSRLLVTSPRVLGRGYTWQDTIAHEYIHLVVAYQTDDRAPVWLQEAIAKYLDARWRDGTDRFRLSVASQGLLAEAVRTGEFVTFDEMHPSLAKLPSQERAALAYAQLATLMAYAFQRGGEGVLLRTLPLVKQGMDPRDALAQGAGATSFAELEAGWRRYVEGLKLVSRDVQPLPTVLDGGDDLDADPTLHDREDLARYVRLGDLLREKGRDAAALVEYTKAIPKDESMGPLLANRLAQSHIALGRPEQAKRILEESLLSYPEFALSHKTLGAVLRERGDARGALRAYTAAVELNPFDPEVQRALAELYEALGDPGGAARHTRYLRILRPNI